MSSSSAAVLTVLALIFATLPGCTYLPSSGPSEHRIKKQAGTSYELIPITSDVVEILGSNSNRSERNSLGSLKTGAGLRESRLNFRVSNLGVNTLPAVSPPTIAVGDVIHVTMYEASGTLFGTPSPTGGTNATGNQLPPQPVDHSGAITVPYAGRIPVKGRSPFEVETEIVEKLKGKAINPQVVVSIGERRGGSMVTVTGDVRQPKEIQLGFAGTRVLDALATAGGSTGSPRETIVSVIRGSLVRSDLLADIANRPSKNVALQPGDTVVLKNKQRSYLIFGAASQNGRLTFDADQVSLAEAMAHTGGPSDGRSNPAAIYVYRMEPKSLVRKLGYDPKEVVGGSAPVIYNLDLLSPKGFFLARNFEVQDKDIIYFANAGSVGLTKFLGLLGAVTSGVAAPAASASAAGVKF